MKKVCSILILAFLSIGAFAQHEDAIEYSETITVDDLKDYMSILASDALEGRETGTRGQRMAAAFIRSQFMTYGLAPADGESYYQRFQLYRSRPGDTYMMVKGEKKENFKDIIYWGEENMDSEGTLEVVFAGNGDESHYEGLDVTGKAVLVSYKGGLSGLRPTVLAARNKGAGTVLILNSANDEEFQGMVGQFKQYLSGGTMSFRKAESNSGGVFFVPPGLAASILGTDVEKLETAITEFAGGKKNAIKKVKKGEITYLAQRKTETIESENVLGFIEGTDLKEEVIVVTAHYDHIGRQGDVINNGADDDASGTSAVLELAEAFAKARDEGKGPRRSILFMTVSGEEKGLLGSQYYTENPIFPLKNTVTNLNIDMVGRVDPKHEENPDYVYLIGADKLSSELHELSELANKTFTQLELDYTYNDENDPNRFYYRSDHYNFAKNNIPIIFYFNGTHADYHQPTDTMEKINFEILAKRAKLVFHTAWILANRDSRVVVDKVQDTNIQGR